MIEIRVYLPNGSYLSVDTRSLRISIDRFLREIGAKLKISPEKMLLKQGNVLLSEGRLSDYPLKRENDPNIIRVDVVAKSPFRLSSSSSKSKSTLKSKSKSKSTLKSRSPSKSIELVSEWRSHLKKSAKKSRKNTVLSYLRDTYAERKEAERLKEQRLKKQSQAEGKLILERLKQRLSRRRQSRPFSSLLLPKSVFTEAPFQMHGGQTYKTLLHAVSALLVKQIDSSQSSLFTMESNDPIAVQDIPLFLDELLSTRKRENIFHQMETYLYEAALAQYAQHPELADLLEATGDDELVEEVHGKPGTKMRVYFLERVRDRLRQAGCLSKS